MKMTLFVRTDLVKGKFKKLLATKGMDLVLILDMVTAIHGKWATQGPMSEVAVS